MNKEELEKLREKLKKLQMLTNEKSETDAKFPIVAAELENARESNNISEEAKKLEELNNLAHLRAEISSELDEYSDENNNLISEYFKIADEFQKVSQYLKWIKTESKDSKNCVETITAEGRKVKIEKEFLEEYNKYVSIKKSLSKNQIELMKKLKKIVSETSKTTETPNTIEQITENTTAEVVPDISDTFDTDFANYPIDEKIRITKQKIANGLELVGKKRTGKKKLLELPDGTKVDFPATYYGNMKNQIELLKRLERKQKEAAGLEVNEKTDDEYDEKDIPEVDPKKVKEIKKVEKSNIKKIFEKIVKAAAIIVITATVLLNSKILYDFSKAKEVEVPISNVPIIDVISDSKVNLGDYVEFNPKAELYASSYDTINKKNPRECIGTDQIQMISGITYSNADGSIETVFSHDPESSEKIEMLEESGAKQVAVCTSFQSQYDNPEEINYFTDINNVEVISQKKGAKI